MQLVVIFRFAQRRLVMRRLHKTLATLAARGNTSLPLRPRTSGHAASTQNSGNSCLTRTEILPTKTFSTKRLWPWPLPWPWPWPWPLPWPWPWPWHCPLPSALALALALALPQRPSTNALAKTPWQKRPSKNAQAKTPWQKRPGKVIRPHFVAAGVAH